MFNPDRFVNCPKVESAIRVYGEQLRTQEIPWM